MNDAKRDEQMRRWVRAASEGTLQEWEDEVMWGVWFSPDSEDCPPPDALFADEATAKTYAAQSGRPEWDVSPCVLARIVTRNDFRVPDPE